MKTREKEKVGIRTTKYSNGFEDGFEPLESLDLSKVKNFDDLAKAMSKTAFAGRALGEAVDVLETMIKDKDCFVVLTLAGAMTPAKMGLVVCDMIDHGMVNAVVSTGALMTHGFVEAQGMTHFKYKFGEMNDKELYYKGYDRIYDIIELEKNLDDTEFIFREIMKTLDPGEVLCSRRILEECGKWLKENTKGRGILKSAYEKKVPVYIPAFTDCEMGLDFGIYNRRRKRFNKEPYKFDSFLDLDHFTDLIRKQKTIGIFTVGGGVPRNWAQQIAPYIDIMRKRMENQCPDCEGKGCEKCGKKGFLTDMGEPSVRYKYGVRICPEPVHWGGLCLHGDTKIEIPRNLEEAPEGVPIRNLVGMSNIPVYSFDSIKKRICISNIRRVLKTGRKKLYKVKFSWISGWGQKEKKLNSRYIVASADHKFFMRDGKYKKVSELKSNDRLMPFNTYYKADKHGDYRFVSLNNGKRIAEHHLIAQAVLGMSFAVDEVVHHKDHNTLNNDINNLIVMNKREHISYHRSVETLETKKKRAKAISEISDPKKMRKKSMKFWNNLTKEEYELLCLNRKEVALNPKERIRRSNVSKTYWNKLSKEQKKIRLRNAHNSTKQRWSEIAPEVRSALVANEKNPKFMKGIVEEKVKDALIKENGSIKNAAKRLKVSVKVLNKRREMYGINRNWVSQNCIENHFVTSIKYYGEEETYDITVDDTHNFVANGIVVSNSGCTYSEGVSWGKFMPKSEGGKWAEVLADATIAWPIVVKAVMERLNIK